MFKNLFACLMAAATLASVSTVDAIASDRYGQRPPVVVGDSLTAPWINQLGRRTRVVAPISGAPSMRQVAPVQQGAAVNGRRIIRYAQPQAQPVSINRQAAQQSRQMDPRFLPQVVDYQTKEKPGSIVIDTNERFLYLVMANGKAKRYGVGVGKPGFEWAGTHTVSSKKEWPSWTPPKEMIAREAAKGHYLPNHMEGGPANPLGARALYLGSTLYRIHGTNAPWTIGYAVSSGCIRMRNEDVIDLYGRVGVGTKVRVI
ncbi:L,D-transpeptidase [Rhizobium sp. L1K21]|uniref:L,D-transpeptidase n=1 Tax=Rhizobium sp. L1K21 TaxID=2954933 RepID=UPI0020935FE6|nr:L,D-transpeptidase [Rhizobium sp. L1K21]MCO6186988.1 L,D-transpeptidase [Rhizobium sp. L1K21]